MFGSPLCAVGTKLFLFAFFVGCMIFLSARHPRRVSPQPSSWVQFFCAFFCCCGSVFFFRVEFTSLFRCSRFPCWFARHLQRWCIFQELLVTLGGLVIVGMYTFESSASRLVLLWLVLSHYPRPVCFSCTAFAGSCFVKDGVRLGDRDGFSLL